MTTKQTSPARQAAYLWIYRTAGFTAALRFVLWSEFVDSGLDARDVAKRIGWWPRKLWRVLLDGNQKLKLDHVSDVLLAFNKELDLTARCRETGAVFASYGRIA